MTGAGQRERPELRTTRKRGTREPGLALSSEQTAGSARGGATERWLMLAVALFVLLLGGYRLGAPSIHVDEGASYVLARVSLAEFWQLLTGSEVSGGPYYLFLRLWSLGGTAEWFLRVPALLASVAMVPLFWLVARRLVDSLTVRIALLLLATNALLLTWAREVRAYAVVLLLVTGCVYAFLRVLRGGGRAWGYAWAVLGALAFSTHIYASFVVISHVLVFLLFERRRDRLLQGGKYLGLLGLLSLPMVAVLALNYPPPAAFHYEPLKLYDIGSFGREFSGVPRRMLVAIPGALVALGALRSLLTIRRSWGSWEAQAWLIILLWAVVPIASVVLVSVRHPTLHGRYLIMVLPAYLLLLAYGLGWLRARPLVMWLAIGAVVAVGVPGVLSLYDSRGSHDWRGVVAEIERGWQPGDALHVHAADHPALAYYLERSTLADHAPITVYGYPDMRRVYMARTLPVIAFQDVSVSRVREQRLWHVARLFHPDFQVVDADEQVIELGPGGGRWHLRSTATFPHSPDKPGLVSTFDVSLLERS